jgi:hypothetical protein
MAVNGYKRERTARARHVCPTCKAGVGQPCLSQREGDKRYLVAIKGIHAARTALVETPIRPLTFHFENDSELTAWLLSQPEVQASEADIKVEITGYRGNLESIAATIWLLNGRYMLELDNRGPGWNVIERRTYP